MQLIPALLFGISASLDALVVGISYGIRKVRISFLQNLFIGMVTLLGTCLIVGFGQQLIPLIPLNAEKYAGSTILIFFGVTCIAKWGISLWKNHRQYTSEDAPHALEAADTNPPSLCLRELFLLSLTLSLNDWSVGLSASLSGLALIPAATVTLICSTLFLLAGNRLGQTAPLRFLQHAADPLSGILLIGLGLIQLIF